MSKKTTDNLTVVKDDTVSFEDYKELQDTIQTMDALSQEGFDQIIAISNLILKSLELPRNDLEDIAHAIKAIKHKSQMIMDCINGEAENVGCQHSDHESMQRRFDAFRQSYKGDLLNSDQQ